MWMRELGKGESLLVWFDAHFIQEHEVFLIGME